MKFEVVKNNHGSRFTWFFGKEPQGEEPTRISPRRPASRDMSAGFTANEDMLVGLYHGNFRGLQFASPLAFTPISMPVQMMGLPTPHSDDPVTQAALDEITDAMAGQMPKLHRSFLLLGNTWRWPRFDASLLAPAWEIIPDKIVTDIQIDLPTGRMNAILTHEKIKLSVGENKTANVERKRIFTARDVSVKWSGEKPENIQDFSARNVAGILPVLFAHDVDEEGFRGYSALSRIIRDLKDYHDTDFRASEALTRFRIKQKQKVKDVGAWLENNFGSKDASALAEYDITGNDLVINVEGEETSYEFLPGEAMVAIEKALERKFWKVVEGSGIPELFWGPLATGNHASTDTQLEQAVAYINSIRAEITKAYYDLYAGTLAVMSVARMQAFQPFAMGWNRLESVSPMVKAQILSSFAQAVANLENSATATPEQLYELWKLNFPETKPGKYEDWRKGINEMALHKQFVGEMYGSGLEDFNGGTK